MGLIFLLLFLYWISVGNWKHLFLWALESEDTDWVNSKLSFFLLIAYHDSKDVLDSQYILA